MQLVNLETRKPNLNDLIQKAIQLFHFQTVVVLGIDHPSGQLFDLSSPEHDNIDALLTRCLSIMRIIESEQKALLINGEFSYKNEMFHPYASENAAEVYVPVFQEYGNTKKMIGIIYFEYQPKQSEYDLINDEFIDYICELNLLVGYRYDMAKRKVSTYHLAYMLCEIIDMKEPYAIGRLFDVALWCERIAKEMGLPQTDIDKLQIASLMHDLGKIYISEDILNKNGKLTEDEYRSIKKRVIYSYEIAESFKELHGLYDLPEII